MTTLSAELSWRGFINQTTFKDIRQLDKQKLIFYWGVDPSSDSMTVGNLSIAMMIRILIKYGYQPILLIGGATGLIGDPDGKASERELISKETIAKNIDGISKQYRKLFSDYDITIVNNADWFKDFNYLDFLRNVGKHVPMRQMLARDFVETRLRENGAGISYAEFSYVLIQAYDFLYLNKHYGVNLQVCGSDQWGNSIAGVDLIRRVNDNNANVLSAPLIVDPITKRKFGKSEKGAVWLDPNKTTPTSFFQFWVNTQDIAVEQYLKIYSNFDQLQIEEIIKQHQLNPKLRSAQFKLAENITTLVHGQEASKTAFRITKVINNQDSLKQLKEQDFNILKQEISFVKTSFTGSIIKALLDSGLAESTTSAKRLIKENAIYLNHQKITRDYFVKEDFVNHYALLRKGKAFKDSALVAAY